VLNIKYSEIQVDKMLVVNNVSKSFGGIKALDGCSLKVRRGENSALIGSNGSGKTTLFNVVSSLIKPDTGKVEFNGVDITGLEDYRVARLGISRTFQQATLFPKMTVEEHLRVAMADCDESLIKSFLDGAGDLGEAGEAVKLVKLSKKLGTPAGHLSYGQRKLLDLAVALAKKHSLLMLDEPVAGVNPKLREEIKAVLRSLKADGETTFFIEHDMDFVMDVADTVYVMDGGRITASGTPDEISGDNGILEKYLGGMKCLR